jgi:hypothetical protein
LRRIDDQNRAAVVDAVKDLPGLHNLREGEPSYSFSSASKSIKNYSELFYNPLTFVDWL